MPHEEIPRFHPCFGGYAACSGVNPCKTCKIVLRDNVDARAVVAASLNGAMLSALHAMAGALRQMGIDPQQVGVPPELLQITPDRQVQAFWTAREMALTELHRQMDGGALAGTFLVTDVGVSPPMVVQPIVRRYGQAMPAPQAQQAPQQDPRMGAPYGYGPAADTLAPSPGAEQAAPAPSLQPVAAPQPHAPTPAADLPKPIARPRPLTAADVAAAATPVAAERSPSNRDVNGAAERTDA
jgi:hypothetical protein